jgi:type IV fimbrial biogenesis protein FimT
MMKNVQRRSRGFTLIELAVTVALLGLLLAASAPGILDWLRNSRIRNVATSVTVGLQKARMEAIRRNAPVRFVLVNDACTASAGGIGWVVSINDPGGNCAEASIIERSGSGIGAGVVTVAATAADATATHTVSFNGFGEVLGVGAIATVAVDGAAGGVDHRDLRIVVGSGGTVRMCDPAVTLNTDPRKC